MAFLDTKLPSEQARKQMDEKMARDLKWLRVLKWSAVIFTLLLIGFVVLFITVIRPALAYRAAFKALEEERFDDAISRFAALGDYKEAVTMEQESRRLKGYDLVERGRYEEACRTFAALGAYEDSAEMVLESRYQKGQALESDGQLVAAAKEFAELPGYKDADDLAVSLRRRSAEALEEAGDLKQAAAVYATLPDAGKLAEEIAKQQELWTALQPGDAISFGVYEQDNVSANGPEPIEWRVLEADGETVLLISAQALECKVYNSNQHRATWEVCYLRDWLNGEFYLNAFDEGEKAWIETTTIVSEHNPTSKYDPDPGNDTRDNVFLLSIGEAERYFAANAERICTITPAALEHGAYTSTGDEAWWWLRGPGNFGAYAPFVDKTGAIDVFGNSAINTGETVRPAIRVQIKY